MGDLAGLALPSVLLVAGTGTEVGKSVATAAVASVLRGRGTPVAVVKVAQSGVLDGEPGDIDLIERLVPGLPVEEFSRLADPLAPEVAARRAGVTLPPVATHAATVADRAASGGVVLVEGSGGLLVGLDSRGGTLADLGVALRYKGVSAACLLVCSSGLGVLNVAALTAEALRHRSLPLLGLVLGDWPAEPGLADRCNVEDLPRVAKAPLLGTIPHGAGALAPTEFAAAAPTWFA